MPRNKTLVSETRNYLVMTVAQAREITTNWLSEIDLVQVIKLGLPEVDDRYHIWRVPLKNKHDSKIGEVVIDAYTTGILGDKTTKPEMLEARLLQKRENGTGAGRRSIEYPISTLRNTVGQGDSSDLIEEMPAESVDLIFTSPPILMPAPNIPNMKNMSNTYSKCDRSFDAHTGF